MRHVYSVGVADHLPSMIETTSRKHRSHLHRNALDKQVRITDGDVRDIFEPLARYSQLTTRQLVAFGERHPVITKARLGELWHTTAGDKSHWLRRLNEEIVFANHLIVEDMHALGDEAAALLQARGIIPAEPWVEATRVGGHSRAPSRVIRLAHDHMACDILIDIEIGARKANAPFRSHIDILNAAPEETRAQPKPLQIPVTLGTHKTFVEPDALFAIGDRVLAIEADRGTESIARVIVPKILAYREIVSAGVIDDWLGVDNLTVLFATDSEARMRYIMKELAKIARNNRSVMFGFRAERELRDFLRAAPPSGRLFETPWKRVGYEDLVLATV